MEIQENKFKTKETTPFETVVTKLYASIPASINLAERESDLITIAVMVVPYNVYTLYWKKSWYYYNYIN